MSLPFKKEKFLSRTESRSPRKPLTSAVRGITEQKILSQEQVQRVKSRNEFVRGENLASKCDVNTTSGDAQDGL